MLTDYTPQQLRKSAVAAISLVLTGLNFLLEGALLPEGWAPYIQAGIGLATLYGVYRVPNAPALVTPGVGTYRAGLAERERLSGTGAPDVSRETPGDSL